MDFLKNRVVPVVVIDDENAAKPLGQALVAGGLPVAEVTFRTAAAPAAIAEMRKQAGLTVGAGTVLNPQQVDQAVEAGAQFIVSPGLNPAVVERAQHHGLPVMPGVITPSEVMQALSMGLTTVKFFPAGAFGIAVLRDYVSPFGQMKFVPTGGISTANLAEYLSLPNVPAVGGSWMVAKKLINAGEFDEIQRLCAEAVAAVANLS
jgi:2-dehydro-3-deoxyphosphogluconate aldolase/(4S)-4-hydroxy-2-oxoglutarate aldolase